MMVDYTDGLLMCSDGTSICKGEVGTRDSGQGSEVGGYVVTLSCACR